MEHKLFSILNEILYLGLDNTQVTTLDGDQDTTPYFGTKENIHLQGKHVAIWDKKDDITFRITPDYVLELIDSEDEVLLIYNVDAL